MKVWIVLLASLFIVSCSSAGKKSSEGEKGKEPTKAEGQMKVTESKTAAARTDGKAVDQPRIVKCKAPGDERELSVVRNDLGRCEMLYSKGGETQKKGEGNGFSGFCDRLLGTIQSNLESAGFSCAQ